MCTHTDTHSHIHTSTHSTFQAGRGSRGMAACTPEGEKDSGPGVNGRRRYSAAGDGAGHFRDFRPDLLGEQQGPMLTVAADPFLFPAWVAWDGAGVTLSASRRQWVAFLLEEDSRSLQLPSLASWGRGGFLWLHLSQGPSSARAWRGTCACKTLSGKEGKEHSAGTAHKKFGCRTEGTNLHRAVDCHASATHDLLGGVLPVPLPAGGPGAPSR